MHVVDYRDDDFEWDEEKSKRNLRVRGFDFAFAILMFRSDCYIEAFDDRCDYGEERSICIGLADDILIRVTYTWRGQRRRIISARQASKEDENEFIKAYAPRW
jgi:uncharacterized DUF497 family protein